MLKREERVTIPKDQAVVLMRVCLSITVLVTLILSIFFGLLFNGTLRKNGWTRSLDNLRSFEGYPIMYGISPLTYHGEFGFRFEDIPDLSGKTAIVTGANVGLGYYTALHLARNGARVVMGCRSSAKCEAASARVRANLTSADVPVRGGSAVPEVIDLSSLESVEQFASHISGALDIVVFNAGFVSRGFAVTKDGIESQWQVNHVGHMYLYALLEDSIVAAAEQNGYATVTSVSSNAHFGATSVPLTVEEINRSENFDPMTRYKETKLANVLFVMEAQRRVQKRSANVFVNAAHPGAVDSDFVRRDNIQGILGERLGAYLFDVAKTFTKACCWDSETASATQLYTAVSTDIWKKDIKAKFFHPIARLTETSRLATRENAEALWIATESAIDAIVKRR